MVADNIKLLTLGIVITLLLLSICITVDYADNITINDNITVNNLDKKVDTKLNNTTMINGSYYILENGSGIAKIQNNGNIIIKKPKYPIVTITAKPSCGCGRHYSYRWRTRSFVDYCPHCHRYGVLRNVHKPQAKWEQELTCTKCRADYCGNCGHEKYSWSKYYLRKA